MKKEWGIFALLRHRYVRIPFSVGGSLTLLFLAF